MDVPPQHVWPEGSAAGEPRPPGSGTPARPVLHLVALAIVGLPVLLTCAAMALLNSDWILHEAGLGPQLLLLFAAALWTLILLALVKSARECVVAIRERRRS